MKFTETRLRGAFIIDLERIADERGFFARSFCAEEFEARGLDPACVQCNISHNRRRGTLRGMHYQNPPHLESKLVRCTMGAIYDVIVDLRRGSETFSQRVEIELSQENRRMLFIPKGFAHGFQTLADDAEVFYQMSTPFVRGTEAGLRYDDAALGITWPLPVTEISVRDRQFPMFDQNEFLLRKAVGGMDAPSAG